MAIQLRHQTQQQRLPSATSHGVGLPVSDGGLGAASRALGQVAGAAGQIGSRLARKQDALYQQRAQNIASDAGIEFDRLTKEIEATRSIGGDPTPLIDELRTKFDPESPDFGLQRYKGDREIDDKYLDPYEQRFKETYGRWQNSEQATKLVQESVKEYQDAHLPAQGITSRVMADQTVTEADMVEMRDLISKNLESPLLDVDDPRVLASRLREPLGSLENFVSASVATASRKPNVDAANQDIENLREFVQEIPTKGYPQLEEWKADTFSRLKEFKAENTSSSRVGDILSESELGMEQILNEGAESFEHVRQLQVLQADVESALTYANENQKKRLTSLSKITQDLQTFAMDPNARFSAIQDKLAGKDTYFEKGVQRSHRNYVEEYLQGAADRFEEATENGDAQGQLRALFPQVDSTYKAVASEVRASRITLGEGMKRVRQSLGEVKINLAPEKYGIRYNERLEVPFLPELTQEAFARNKSGNFVKSPSEILHTVGIYGNAVTEAGFDKQAVIAQYIGSDDPEMSAFAQALHLFTAAGGDLNNNTLQAFVSEEDSGPALNPIVDKALAFAKTEDGFRFPNIFGVSQSLYAQQEDDMGALVGGLREPLIRRIIQELGVEAFSKGNLNKGIEEALRRADQEILSVYTPLKFESAGFGQDSYIMASSLDNANIDSGLLARMLTDAVSPKSFAREAAIVISDSFTTKYGEAVGGVSLFRAMEMGPNPTQQEKNLAAHRRILSDAFREALSGDKNELNRLMNDGHIRFNMNATDEMGNQVIALQVKQNNGSWRYALDDNNTPVQVPLRVLNPVIKDPVKTRVLRRREKARPLIEAHLIPDSAAAGPPNVF